MTAKQSCFVETLVAARMFAAKRFDEMIFDQHGCGCGCRCCGRWGRRRSCRQLFVNIFGIDDSSEKLRTLRLLVRRLESDGRLRD